MRGLAVVTAVGMLAACGGATPRPAPAPAPTPAGFHAGDRDGHHGMALFGRTHYYLDHIPMFHAPHDVQLVLRVSLRTADGRAITDDFSDQGYSISPTTRFSLDDVALGKRRTFTADIHRGNYEADGPRLYAAAEVTVDAVVIARPLPGPTIPVPTYLVLGDPGEAYLINLIGPARGFQQVLRLATIEGLAPLLDRAQPVHVSATTRLSPGAVTLTRVLKPAVHAQLAAELWCLEAPEFVTPCR